MSTRLDLRRVWLPEAIYDLEMRPGTAIILGILLLAISIAGVVQLWVLLS